MTGEKNDWQPLLEDLERRQSAGRQMGGPEKLARQRAGGRLDARARIAALCDPGSFTEIGALVGGIARGGRPPAPADALIIGHGAIEGRPVVVGAEDFTVAGGSIGLGTHAKRMRAAQLAMQERVPLVFLLEGAGERVTNSLERYPYAPNDLQALAALSALLPSVAVVLGASAGHGALTAPLMDFVIMAAGGALFSAGPPLVEMATGERVTKEELGGAAVHTAVSGVAHNVAANDAEALALARRYLSYFPSNAWSRPPRARSRADIEPRRLEAILEVVPANVRKPYDIRGVIALLADEGTFADTRAADRESSRPIPAGLAPGRQPGRGSPPERQLRKALLGLSRTSRRRSAPPPA